MKDTEASTIDVLIARLSTHPEEFFNADAVVTQDGARIFQHTKWRRITAMLMDPTNGPNLWVELFKPAEKQRFRDAMHTALRGVLDTQMMKVLMGGDPIELDPEEKARREEVAMKMAHQQQYMAAKQQLLAQQSQALQNIANQTQGLQGSLTVGYGSAGGGGSLWGSAMPQYESYEKHLDAEERKAFEKIAKASPPKTLAEKVKKYFP